MIVASPAITMLISMYHSSYTGVLLLTRVGLETIASPYPGEPTRLKNPPGVPSERARP